MALEFSNMMKNFMAPKHKNYEENYTMTHHDNCLKLVTKRKSYKQSKEKDMLHTKHERFLFRNNASKKVLEHLQSTEAKRPINLEFHTH